MKILDILGESLRTERNVQQSNANILRDLYSERNTIKNELNAARIDGDEDEIADMVQQLADIDADIRQMEGGVNEAKNHMGDREYQSYGSWKAACKKAYPGCSFRGDKDIGAAVVGNKDVGEWDGAVGSVYANVLKESQHDLDMIAGLTKALNRAKAKHEESKEDLHMMSRAARTEREYDAVDDFKKRVEQDAQRVRRIARRIELRKAVHNSGMNDTKG
jgi:hypothetical protein